MSKYGPLERHLSVSDRRMIPMTFDEIEKIIEDDLPPSARKYRAWWSNNPSNSVITYAWLNAGYKATKVNMETGYLVFCRRSESDPVQPREQGAADEQIAKTIRRHPAFGCMSGTVKIASGVDLTSPADPDLARYIDEEYPAK
jgi:hypothetical protein